MDYTPTSPAVSESTINVQKNVSIVQSWWFWTIIVLIVLVVIAIILIIVFTTGKTNSSALPIIPPSLCKTSGEQVPLYVQLANVGNYAFMSTQRSVPGAIVQNGGVPELLLCASSGDSRIPIYAYINPTDGADNRWGTSNVAPSYYVLGNGGLPVGYVYATKNVENTELKPVYEGVANFNNNLTHSGILTQVVDPTFGGVKYPRVSTIPLGYSL